MSGNERRLAPTSSQQVNQASELRFYYEGKSVRAHPGDTIASALYASGRRIFSRSFKYHRPRGLLCCSGDCPNCLVNVDGKPNVRACRTLVDEGIEVRSQHGWPSIDRDLLRSIELFDRFLPVGFYYKTLYQRPVLWKVAEPVIRRLAGIGRVPDHEQEHEEFHHRCEYVDVLVVGGGPAGIAAATSAAAAGATVLLVDQEPRLGGHLRYETRSYSYQGVVRPAGEIIQAMEASLRRQPTARIISQATAFGCYEGKLVPVLQGNTVIHVRARSAIIATGRHQFPAVFENNDLPGVMLSRATLRLINLFGVLPGTTAVIITSGDEGYLAAAECLRAGLRVTTICDVRRSAAVPPGLSSLESVPVLRGMTIRKAIGSRRVSAARIVPADENDKSKQQTIPCDLVLLATGWQTNTALLSQSGCQLAFDKTIGQQVPKQMAAGIFAAGEVLGSGALEDILSSAQRVAKAACQHLREENVDSGDLNQLLSPIRAASSGPTLPSPIGQKKNFVCLCEDVVEKDLRQGVEEGFDEIETLKRYSTASMGPCQGRMCSRNAIEICGRATHTDSGAVGTTTSRPPIYPVPLGALAGPKFHPLKRTSIHSVHVALGARFMNMGVWLRPLVYSSVPEEYNAVRHQAGIIDVSTLGKLLVSGKDAPALLDKVYTHTMSNLKPGRARYGVICDESGIILDDGTVARLSPDRYYITTSTGNVDSIEQWLKWWTAGTGWCAHVVNVTSGNAAVNLAGPKSRDVLGKIADIDISPAALPYMSCREAKVAGVPATLVRLGFVGELGWEIHFPAEFGEYLWKTLLEVGAEVGIRPFGVEAQRLLRLEKKHLIIGQDTDALSNPFDCGLNWVVKLDKPDFIGRHALESIQTQPSQNRLVGFEVTNGGEPSDGSAILIEGKLSGRITSVRFSPLLKKHVGLAWVPAEHARAGVEIAFHANGTVHPALIVEEAFYDKEGARLK